MVELLALLITRVNDPVLPVKFEVAGIGGSDGVIADTQRRGGERGLGECALTGAKRSGADRAAAIEKSDGAGGTNGPFDPNTNACKVTGCPTTGFCGALPRMIVVGAINLTTCGLPVREPPLALKLPSPP